MVSEFSVLKNIMNSDDCIDKNCYTMIVFITIFMLFYNKNTKKCNFYNYILNKDLDHIAQVGEMVYKKEIFNRLSILSELKN